MTKDVPGDCEWERVVMGVNSEEYVHCQGECLKHQLVFVPWLSVLIPEADEVLQGLG